MGNDIQKLITLPAWTPRAEFSPSRLLSDGRLVSIFSCDNGLYLMTNRNFGDNDPVWAVGWAESDHWALRVWGSPTYAGDLKSPPAQWALPSLVEVGRPGDLSYASVVAYEKGHPEGKGAAGLVTAKFRFTDGEILHSDVNGYAGVTYCYEAAKPKAADLPTAIEFRLPG
ncbi:hypothetical protein [Catenulispora rubra]|uniref:hypothetical protein n=1 Tax=Catenulispora rubra TaxID=280293 RepID=UPI0018923E40|nr:hypothetical protein [Catenulispora rubra]